MNAELIARARKAYFFWEPKLSAEVVDALEATEREHAALTEQLVASQAAIARVLNLIGDIGPEARRILTQLPDDTLTVHDKQVAAQTLRDAAADIHARGDVGEEDGPTTERYLTIRAKNIEQS